MLSLPRALYLGELSGENSGWVLKAFILEDERGQKGQQGLLRVPCPLISSSSFRHRVTFTSLLLQEELTRVLDTTLNLQPSPL